MARSRGAEPAAGPAVSVTRVRAGILLFLVWWLPVYLLTPAIAGLFGKENDASARHTITVCLVAVQTVLGLLGCYLAGRELFSTLKRVRRRRVVPVAWHIVWSGDTRITEHDLRKPKARVPAGDRSTDRASSGTDEAGDLARHEGGEPFLERAGPDDDDGKEQGS